MKQKTKIFIIVSIISVSFGGFVFSVESQKKSPVLSPPSTQISGRTDTAKKQSTTVKIEKSTSSSSAKKTKVAKSSDQPIITSPKHQQIKQLAATEYTYRIFAMPNDPLASSAWTLQKVNAPTAWNSVTGNDQTIVAVIDGGFALAHQDLGSQWYGNPGETGTTQSGDTCWTGSPANKQSNACDDDANGYVDDHRGWSFALEDNNPQAGRENPTGNGVTHGTQVAGQVGATGNNGLGSTAINWHTKIMPLQALNDEGIGFISDVFAAVYYAVDNGADVINISLGTFSDDPLLRTAVNYAVGSGVVVVAASANCGDGDPESCQGAPAGTIAYPAMYPNVIAVGATTESDQRASFSSYGPALDVVAPGSGTGISPSWSAVNQTSLYT